MAKKVTGYIKLQIPAGKATPAPPVGPALGQHGVNIVQFTKEFNARTADKGDLIIPVVITVYADRSFSFITKTPPAAVLLKKACNLKSGSGVPNKTKVATISKDKVREIAEMKMPDLNAATVEAAMSMIATPAGAAARLMSGGKSGAEKDLGLMAMTYGHVYVAQVAMGANPNQLLKAMREAEAWDGAALIIAYAPCIAHGIDMRDVQEIEKDAVKCGYFPLYRYHPANGLMLDSKAPDGDFQAFLMRQGRFAALRRSDPAKSETLCKMAEEAARRRWNLLEMLKNRKMP